MILEAIYVALGAAGISIVGYLLVKITMNHHKQRLFRVRAKGLPVLASSSIFSGHANPFVHSKDNLLAVDGLHKKYGPTFGLFYGSKPAASTIDLDFIKTFARDEPEHVNRFIPDIPIKEFEYDCIVTASDEQWKRLRSVIAPAISSIRINSPNVMRDINKMMDKFVGSMERKLREAKDKRGEDFIVENIDDICQRYTTALVFSNFYKQDNVVDFESEKDSHVELVDKGLKNMVCFWLKVCTALPILKPLISWLCLHFDDQGTMRKRVMNYIRQQTMLHFKAIKQTEVLASSDELRDPDTNGFMMDDGMKFRRNFVDYIIDQYRAGKLTRQEYFNSTFFLFFAANRTSAELISKCLYHLAGDHRVQEKLRKSIEAEGVESEYLSWVINESLRLFPPVPLGCSRTIKRDIQTKNGLVPAGTFVFTPVYTISRLTEYWGQDSNEFRPERWENSKDFHPAQYLVFGLGRRFCPGKALAMLVSKMLICNLLRTYRFDRPDKTDGSQRFHSPIFIFLVFDKPTKIKISRLVDQESR